MTLVAVLSIATACHDAVTRPVAPVSAGFNVSSDGTWMVNSLADPGDGICASNECTLREAIVTAQSGDRITFKSNLSGTIALVGGVLAVDRNLTIEGPGARTLTVNGQSASTVFEVGPTSGQPVIATISGLTIAGGHNFFGGGAIIVNYESRLALIGSMVVGSSAPRGGGIHNGGRLTLISTTVAGNDAGIAGGGIFNQGILTVSRSTISGNRSLDLGGGIYTHCGLPVCGDGLTIRSSTITNNQAASGGGVYVDDQGVIFNTILAGNRVDDPLLSPDCAEFGGFTSLGYTLTTTLGCGGLNDSPTDIVVPASQVFTAVLGLLLTDNGGRVATHALFERGFAVDAGYCPGESSDQRGFQRPYDDQRMPNALDGCDIGAFEWQPTDSKKNHKP